MIGLNIKQIHSFDIINGRYLNPLDISQDDDYLYYKKDQMSETILGTISNNNLTLFNQCDYDENKKQYYIKPQIVFYSHQNTYFFINQKPFITPNSTSIVINHITNILNNLNTKNEIFINEQLFNKLLNPLYHEKINR